MITIAIIKKKTDGKFRDTWLKKKWIPIKPPTFLGNEIIGHTVCMKKRSPVGRTTIVSLGTLTKNVRDHNISIKLKLSQLTEGNICMTEYRGQEINKNQIMMAVRRGFSRIDNIEILTLDKVKIRIKTIVLTRCRVSSAIKHSLRAEIKKEMEKTASSCKVIETFLSSVNTGKMQADTVKQLKKIYPCREMIVRKIEVL